jgi:hypothetical protein
MNYSGQELAIRVRYFNSLGNGQWSDYAYATPADVPSVSSSVGAYTSMLNQGAVRVDLLIPNGNGSPVSTVQIQAALNDSFSSIAEEYEGPFDTVGSYTSVEITGLEGGVTYFFRARFANDIGYGGWTTTTMSASASASVPGQVQSFTATPNYSTQQFDFAWTAPSNGGSVFNAITIEDAESEEFDNALQRSPYYGDTSYSAQPGGSGPQPRYLRIRYTNGIGDGPWSAVQQVVFADPPDPPTIISAIANPDTGYTDVYYQAPASNGGSTITGYRFYFDGDERSPETDTGGFARFDRDYQGSGFQMSAINAVGEGAFSNYVTVSG